MSLEVQKPPFIDCSVLLPCRQNSAQDTMKLGISSSVYMVAVFLSLLHWICPPLEWFYVWAPLK